MIHVWKTWSEKLGGGSGDGVILLGEVLGEREPEVGADRDEPVADVEADLEVGEDEALENVDVMVDPPASVEKLATSHPAAAETHMPVCASGAKQ